MNKNTLIVLLIPVITACATIVPVNLQPKKQVKPLTAEQTCKNLDGYSKYRLEESLDYPDMVVCTFRHDFMHPKFVGYRTDSTNQFHTRFDVLGIRKLQETKSYKFCQNDKMAICKGTNFYIVALLRTKLLAIPEKGFSNDVLKNSEFYTAEVNLKRTRVVLPNITNALVSDTLMLAHAIYRSNKFNVHKANSCPLVDKILNYKKWGKTLLDMHNIYKYKHVLLNIVKYTNYVYIKDVLYFNDVLYNYLQALYGCVEDQQESAKYMEEGERVMARIFAREF